MTVSPIFQAFLVAFSITLGLLYTSSQTSQIAGSWKMFDSLKSLGKLVMGKGVYTGASKWTAEMGTLYTLSANDHTHKKVDFNQYKNKLCLITNVASQCGYTKSSYEAMQTMIDHYSSQGLEVLLFPCNQFMGQEPTSAEEAMNQMCTMFGDELSKATFFEKGDVNGDHTQPVYQWLKQAFPGDITWNFASKFIIGPDGVPLQRFDQGTSWEDIDAFIVEHLPTSEASSAAGSTSATSAVAATDEEKAADDTSTAEVTSDGSSAAPASTDEDFESDSSSVRSEPDFESEPEAAVDFAIKSGIPILVISKTYCPYCKAIKKRLNRYVDIKDTSVVRIIELDRMPSQSARRVQNYMGKITGETTVPRLFIAGESIGGNSDSERLESDGTLEKLITNAVGESAMNHSSML